jgi:dTDP-4-dehydrorhamnose reductase
VDDLEFAPSAARDVADRVVALFEKDAPPGTYHLANAGRCTWFGFARAILDEAGLSADLQPIRSEGGPARPRCSVLLDTKTNDVGLAPAREWRTALTWYLTSRSGSPGALDQPMTRSEE